MNIDESKKNVNKTLATSFIPKEKEEIFTSTIISNMLNKYELKENDKELFQKFFGDKVCETNGEIIFWISTRLANGKILEKNLPSILKERLKISHEIAEQLAEDIKKNLLPMLKKPKEKTMGKTQTQTEINKSDITIKTKSPIGVERTLNSEKNIQEKTKTEILKEKNIKFPSTKKKSREKVKKIKNPSTGSSSGQDSYREPIN